MSDNHDDVDRKLAEEILDALNIGPDDAGFGYQRDKLESVLFDHRASLEKARPEHEEFQEAPMDYKRGEELYRKYKDGSVTTDHIVEVNKMDKLAEEGGQEFKKFMETKVGSLQGPLGNPIVKVESIIASAIRQAIEPYEDKIKELQEQLRVYNAPVGKSQTHGWCGECGASLTKEGWCQCNNFGADFEEDRS